MAEIKVPELAESITEGTIAQWLKQPGETVEKGEFIVELETDKVNVEVISEEAGVVQEHLAQEGETVEVGQVIAIVGAASGAGESSAPAPKAEEPSAKAEAPATMEPVAKDPAAEEQTSSDRTIASPAARKLAREKGIDLAAISPVDPMGRVRVQDVEAHSSQPAAASAPAAKTEAPKAAAAPSSDEENGRIVREKMSRRRQTIAKRLLEVKQSTAMLTTFNEIDMTNVMALRSRKKDKFQQDHDGTRLGFMSFFTKAVTAALKKYPYVNAELDGTDVLLKQFFDVGIAVSTEEGLVVPIVRDTDKKNFAEIEASIADLAKKARDKKLSIADMTGGSFTITNGGVFGSLMSTPILNGTQVGILGMHTIQKRPVAIGDSIEIRPMMYVALSYDHRVIDGSDSVGFLKMVKDLIENPEDLLLES
ncbi:2-oxoglutarate dehydrogenase complex dihydrolipoyllysine-residue succinyltransferase [Planococcus sp. N028]|uniref:Dihydrolipoyllysine-residue succinyltransferase component of 2-oxoglutarate dehydrogenase complex n=1 Tax=Planococcus shixiaomingii TaxID=3058393 RepID=A0ABT8MZF4_9BACL|nr:MULTISPECIES: 2-oxoglutarate dehydrogenase complex dihydrolipoyllysine-residue succinyltransferase [unclassified Planococcus (in: firmicutes)]MDN7241019.1 2-oxoglutarate dehydrogenase complex dihydrolipoyllysine-residue succinyltransferase [Planococcus sp. N028]WKA53273.1 2-oxoglutarate dehydrogenase complex dihydrolipoyllysine-residue succinyltransferase [Planococcus sp. N022]